MAIPYIVAPGGRCPIFLDKHGEAASTLLFAFTMRWKLPTRIKQIGIEFGIDLPAAPVPHDNDAGLTPAARPNLSRPGPIAFEIDS